MGKTIKWILAAATALVVIIIAALLIIPLFIDVKQYKPKIEQMVSQSVGRPFSIGDDISLSLFPWAGLTFSELKVGNITGFDQKEFISIDAFEARVKLLPLLSKDVQVKKFIISRPKIVLIKNKAGKVNWAFPETKKADSTTKTARPPAMTDQKADAPEPAPKSIPLKALVVGEFAVTDGTVVWIDEEAGQTKEITDATFRLTDVSVGRPIGLEVSAVMDKKPFSLDGTVGPVGKNFLKETIPVNLSISALREIDIALKGTVDHLSGNQGFDFRLDVKPFSLKKVLDDMKLDPPVKTADPEALTKVMLACRIKGNTEALDVSDGRMELDTTTASFSAGAKAFEKPDLTVSFRLDNIDLDRYLPPANAAAETGEKEKTKAKGSKASAIDYAPLRKLLIDATVAMDQLKVKNARLQNVNMRLAGKGGRFRLSPASFDLYEGKVEATGNVDLRTNTPKTTVAATIAGVQSGKLLRDVMEKDFIEGLLNARIEAAATGDDPDRIKKGLNGSGSLNFSDGAIVGIDLANMVRNVGSAFGLAQADGEKPRTDFAELIVPFTIRNGIFDTRNTSMKSPLIRLGAAGTADLTQEILDFRVEPRFVATLKGQGDTEQRSGVTVPVLVGGTFQHPTFKPDLKSLLQQSIQKGVSDPSNPDKILPDAEDLKETGKGLLKLLPFGK